MQIDCRNLACPEPVIRTKKALENLSSRDRLEILLNQTASIQNVKKFLISQKQNFVETKLENQDTIIIATKEGEIEDIDISEFCEIKSKKVIYLNDDKAGSGEVGSVLLSKFLGAFLQLNSKPYAIICVNKAINLTTDRANPSFSVLKNLESAGVKILSCGSCLEAYKLVDKLGVGEISNAYEIAEILTEFDEIKLWITTTKDWLNLFVLLVELQKLTRWV